MKPFASKSGDDLWVIGNDEFELAVGLGPDGLPRISRVISRIGTPLDWTPPSPSPLGPVIEIDGETHAPGSPGLSFEGITVDEDDCGLILNYRCPVGLQVAHTLSPSPRRAAFRTCTTLTNDSDRDIGEISRFDAINLGIGVTEAEPLACYLTGWLDGPRIDAPGRPPAPFPYPSWIYPLLYGDTPQIVPPPPSGGWNTPNLRLIKGERLTRLPLRSGKRSTFDNFPWVCVLDPGRQAGFYASLEWSGTWKMDIEHHEVEHGVSLMACMDSYTHTLAKGDVLSSSPAFMGFFSGDFDDALNASRRYVVDEIMPPMPENYPLVTYDLGPFKPEYYQGTELAWRTEADAAAELGVELYFINASWWSHWDIKTDFSYGLGDFEDNREQFTEGLRGVSNYVHDKGMRFGLWFEFERVDIRTANRGRLPWDPAWLTHHQGDAVRSWCPHIYNLCLGVKAAADWALENMSWAIQAYGVDHIMIDGNEWAVCDDPTHDHEARDGEWAQIHGLYHILGTLRERFPDLLITNCAGGAQRADFAMARYCHALHPHDTKYPSSISRKNNVGVGCIYPTGYGDAALTKNRNEGPVTPDQVEWRSLNRMMSVFRVLYFLKGLDKSCFEVLQRTIATQKKIKRTLQGDRYILNGPAAPVEQDNREAGNWEVYEYLSLGGEQISVFVFRCMSPESEHRLLLRGLVADATYEIEYHSGRPGTSTSGAQLMDEGIVCRLEHTRRADVLILNRL